MRLARWLLVGAAAIGCGGGDSSPAADAGPAADDSLIATGELPDELPPMPLRLDQLTPSDTAGILSLMRTAINYSNAVADRGERRDTTYTQAGQPLAVTVSLWRNGEVPLRLIVARQVAGTAIPEEMLIWFSGGVIHVVQEPQQILLFDADRIAFWTDEGMMPLPFTEEERMLHERAVVDSVEKFLELFGITYQP